MIKPLPRQMKNNGKKKMQKNQQVSLDTCRHWRRRRDSNPRDAINAYTISSRAPSTKLGDFSIDIKLCLITQAEAIISYVP